MGKVEDNLHLAVMTMFVVLLTTIGCGGPPQQTTAVTASATGTTTYYVSTSGNDSANGSIDSPWRTIQHAADSVGPGTTVYVRQGTYNEIVTMKTSGAQAHRLFFRVIRGKLQPLMEQASLFPMANGDLLRYRTSITLLSKDLRPKTTFPIPQMFPLVFMYSAQTTTFNYSTTTSITL